MVVVALVVVVVADVVVSTVVVLDGSVDLIVLNSVDVVTSVVISGWKHG